MLKTKLEIDSIIDWLKTYPEFVKMFDVSKLNDNGQLIDFVGTTTVSENKFLSGTSISEYANDYILQVEKSFISVLARKQNAEFLTNFQKWVREQSRLDLVPQLGNHGKQNTYVDAQQFVGNDTNREVAIYQVMLHIEYKIYE